MTHLSTYNAIIITIITDRPHMALTSCDIFKSIFFLVFFPHLSVLLIQAMQWIIMHLRNLRTVIALALAHALVFVTVIVTFTVIVMVLMRVLVSLIDYTSFILLR